MHCQVSDWYGFERLDFTFEGRKAILIRPGAGDGRWMLKTEYFPAFQDLERALVEKGFHLAYLENENRWGMDADQEAKARFRDFLCKEFSLKPRCLPIGMSCGGLHALQLAVRRPDMVSALYLDAPVVNLFSCPFGFGIGSDIGPGAQQEALNALGLTRSRLIAYRNQPIDHLPALEKLRIPMALVWGDQDTTVPFEENGAYLKDLYERAQIPHYFECKPGCGHHPHGPVQMESAVEFLLRHTRD